MACYRHILPCDGRGGGGGILLHRTKEHLACLPQIFCDCIFATPAVLIPQRKLPLPLEGEGEIGPIPALSAAFHTAAAALAISIHDFYSVCLVVVVVVIINIVSPVVFRSAFVALITPIIIASGREMSGRLDGTRAYPSLV